MEKFLSGGHDYGGRSDNGGMQKLFFACIAGALI